MAIRKSIDFAGQTFPDAYHRITDFQLTRTRSGDYTDAALTIATEVYISDTQRQAGDDPLITRNVYTKTQTLALTDQEYDTVTTVMYDALKRIPPFQGAEDV